MEKLRSISFGTAYYLLYREGGVDAGTPLLNNLIQELYNV